MSGVQRHPLRHVVRYWTTSDGTLVEQLECGHHYATTKLLSEGGTERGRHCPQCAPVPRGSCARCGKPLVPHQNRYCSRACFYDAQRAP